MNDAPAPSERARDEQWIVNVTRMPRARLLIDHLSAFESCICSGGVKGIESPMEQCATMRRIFCYEYNRTNTPLGIPTSGENKKLPACIGICNLSGKHAVYYSDSSTLARIVCLSAQAVNPLVIEGINAVLQRAVELCASIVFFFCMPFQVGLERCHWEMRTLRKTTKGAVKDGEACFCSGDIAAKVVPCTVPLEHWGEPMLRELVRKLVSLASPTCLDRVDEDDSSVKMTPERMEGVIEMLKTDRRKLMEAHRQKIDDLVKDQHVQLANSAKREEDAVEEANMRISKVAEASKVAEDLCKKNMEHLNAQNITLKEQLVDQQTLLKGYNASLVGQKLEREQESKKQLARQKTLESQLSTLKSNIAKQTSQQAKARNDQKTCHDKEVAALQMKVAELQSALASTNAASRAVQASSNEARAHLKDAAATVCELKRTLGHKTVHLRVLKALYSVSAMRHSMLKDEQLAQQRICEAQNIALAEREAEIAILAQEKNTDMTTRSDQIPSLEDGHTKRTLDQTVKELEAARKETCCKDHLAKENEKRCTSLERLLSEANEEIKRLVAKGTDLNTKEVTSKRHHGKRGQHTLHHTDETKVGSYEHSAPNLGKNTPVFMSQTNPSPQSSFPTIDHALEHSISQLHMSLSFITAMARSSNSNARSAEVAYAKLDALRMFGLVHQPVYHEQAVQGLGQAPTMLGNGYGC